MRRYAGGSKAYDVSLPMVCIAVEQSEPNTGQESEPEEYNCGHAEVEGELTCYFLHNCKNTVAVGASRKKRESRLSETVKGRVTYNSWAGMYYIVQSIQLFLVSDML